MRHLADIFLAMFILKIRKRTLRRTLTGILIIISAIAALLLLIEYLPMSLPLRRFAVCICLLMCGFGAGYIIGPTWQITILAGWLSLIIVLRLSFPYPWNIISLLAYAGLSGLLLRLPIKSAAKEPNASQPSNAESPFPELFAVQNNYTYHLLRGNESLYVICVNKVKETISSPDEFVPGKGRVQIRFKDILSVHVRIDDDGAHIYLKARTKTYRWDSQGTFSEISALFEGLCVTFDDKTDGLSGVMRRRKDHLSAVCRTLSIAGEISCFLFFFFQRPYYILAVINLIIPIVFLIIYARNLDYWALFGEKKHERLFLGCYLSVMAMAVRMVCDFNLLSPNQLIVPVCITACAGIALFLALSIGHKKRLKPFLWLLLLIAAHSFAGVVLLNDLLPAQSTQSQFVTTIAKEQSAGRYGSLFYEVTILTDDSETLTLHTSRKTYDQLTVGNEAVYLVETGTFGIDFGTIYPSSPPEEANLNTAP